MENFPKIISSYPESDQNSNDLEQTQSSYVNCNICRNFSNILKVNHRKSKEHQKKMTEKFRSIRNQIKVLGQISVSVHDEEWRKKKESLYCYFCDKSVEKHRISGGLMIESFGYMTHLASPDHAIAVKKYLKYHDRKEKFELFIKTEEQLNKFLEKIPEATDAYLKRLDSLNMKDIQTIKEIEEQRKKLVEETVQKSAASNDASTVVHVPQSSPNFNVAVSKNKSVEKVPPWLLDGKEHDLSHRNISITPVIGPTIETLAKHVTAQKKKGLPSKRLGVKSKALGEYSAKWMPDFRGVWNKGKRKYFKACVKRKF